MDSNDLERERGITILAKNTAIVWNGYRINIVDTPGTRRLRRRGGARAVDGRLGAAAGRRGRRPHAADPLRDCRRRLSRACTRSWSSTRSTGPARARTGCVDQVFDLFDRLGATETQLDFPIIYHLGDPGHRRRCDPARHERGHEAAVRDHRRASVRPPEVDPDGPLQMQDQRSDYTSYVGVIGIGRITRGTGPQDAGSRGRSRRRQTRNGRVLQVLGHLGLERVEVTRRDAGDIVCVTGIERLDDFRHAVRPDDSPRRCRRCRSTSRRSA